MSSPYLLQCALRTALTPVLADFPLATREKGEKEGTRPAHIFLVDLPPRKQGDVELVPFVCMQEQSGKQVESMEQVDVLFRCVVFSGDREDGVQELSNLVQLVRHSLLPYLTKPLDSRYRLLASKGQDVLPWERPLEQQHPYAEAFILSTWDYKGFEDPYVGGL